ncbi:uncharacterized protein LOC100891165 isoform X2 [Strongylocentrotus purpuratus]|uniref:Uncharacterized protein n=1 Tax=Strongylocentrotus purpuratus TaxID=7668 RepID=A0A7M7NMS9_STRPU|nr:uncharacterized protein LOC100891165 isoform X2 [Strongylocentrotus purpuratus]|eukprot:XP_011661517.1 PREDICTED: uncharacterized protein LOC100891165 isoform X2 [Strongylocentrotus purpuratus]
MAILTRCCCFDNVRTGSKACGVYSLIYCLVSVGILLWEFVDYIEMSSYTGAARKGLYAAYSIDLVVLIFLFIASIILLVGVAKNSKCMLIPYMVAIPLLIVLQLISWIIVFVFIGMGEVAEHVIDIAQCVVWFVVTAPKILCLICVLSQYQELKDGRGRQYNMV